MKTNTHRKPDPRLNVVKVYLGDEEQATLESHCAAADIPASAFLRRAGLRIIDQYRVEQAAAEGAAPAGDFMRSVRHIGQRIASAHQQVIRYPGRREGPSAGLGRAFSFPGQGARRVQRGALRPMRS